MRVTRQRVVAAGAACVGLALAFWVLRPRPIRVDVATARRAPLQVTVDEEGETRVRHRYVVAAPTNGRLLRLAVDEGDAVEPGQVVARVEPAPLDPRDTASARAQLEAAAATQHAADAREQRAEAMLAQARRDAERAARLHRAGTLSDDALERARLGETSAVREVEEARHAAEAAVHEVEAARAVLMAASTPGAAGDGSAPPCAGAAPCVEVRSPVAGQVLRVREESERIVAAGTPLLDVGDPASLEIVTDILSTDAVPVTPGARVLVEDWGGEGVLEGRVRLVEPSAFTKVSALGVEEQRVNVIADLLAPEPRLGDGYRVEVRIVTWEGDDVLQIPASALFRTDERWSVYVVQRGRARLRIIGTGPQARFDVAVKEGLEPGEVVILHPSDRIRDGTRVAVR
jgi:HlyD family secretion protein